MKKLYCDRCGAECRSLYNKTVPDKMRKAGTYETKEVELCKGCNDYVSKAEDIYNEAMVKVRFAFYESILPDNYKKENEHV